MCYYENAQEQRPIFYKSVQQDGFEMRYAHNSRKVNTKYVLFSEKFFGLFRQDGMLLYL